VANSKSPFPQVLIDYQWKAFATKADLFSYVSNSQYLIGDDYPGVCFGFEINNQTESDYAMQLFFND